MDPIKDIYKNIIREEIENPEVQNAKEAFFQEQFETVPASSSPSFWGALSFSPSFRLALVGCLALLVLVKTGAFETATQDPASVIEPEQKLIQTFSNAQIAETAATMPSPVKVISKNNIQIKKLSSQMGSTIAYQKNFPDVQITVVWVLPKGV